MRAVQLHAGKAAILQHFGGMREAGNDIENFIMLQRARLAESRTRHFQLNVGWADRCRRNGGWRLPPACEICAHKCVLFLVPASA